MFATPFCHYHPDRETMVSCGRCERPLCPDCVRHGATGVRCRECVQLPPRAGGLPTPDQMARAATASLVVAAAGGILLGWLGYVNLLTGLALGFAVGSAAFWAARRHRGPAIHGIAGMMSLVGLLLAAVILSLRGGTAEAGGAARVLLNLPYAQFVLPALASIAGAILRLMI